MKRRSIFLLSTAIAAVSLLIARNKTSKTTADPAGDVMNNYYFMLYGHLS